MSEIARQHPADATVGDAITVADVRRYAALALAGSFVGYFMFTGMPQLTLEVFPRTITHHILFGAVALAYVGYLGIARRLPGGSPIDLPLLGFIAAYMLATYASINWRVSLEWTLSFGAAVIVFYALADLPLLSASLLRRALVLVTTAVSLYAVWIVTNDYADYLSLVREVEGGINSGNIFPPTVPRVHGVSDHPNVLAMVLALFMPFLALGMFRGSGAIERVGSAFGFCIAALAVFLTLSRGGWIGVAGGTLFTIVGAALTVRAWQREQQGFPSRWDNIIPRDISPTAIATILGAIALIVGGTLAFLSNASTRPGWLFRSSLSPREDAWGRGLEMFGDYPLIGSGPNTFGLLYAQYGGRFLVHTQHAHNGFLQLANDAGIVGLVALAVLAGAIAYMLLRTWREGDLEQRLLAVACAGGLIGFTLHNQLDAGNLWKSPAIGLALVGAIIVRNYRERAHAGAPPAMVSRLPEQLRRYLPLGVRGALLVLIALPFVAWYRIDSAHHDYWRGMELAIQGDANAIARLQDAVDGDSSMMVYRLELGRALANAYVLGGEQEPLLIQRALVHLEQAARLDPRSDIAQANLARAYQLAGRDEDAARVALTVRLAVHHVPPVLAVGEVYELLGYEEEAISTYAQVIGMDAGLADSTYWDGTEWRREHYDDILAESALGVNPCTYGSYIVQGRRLDPARPVDELPEAREGCQLLALGYPNDLYVRTALGRILYDLGDVDAAFGHLDYAVSRQPDFGPARTELGRWYAAEGNLEEARRQWVVAGQLDESEAIMLLGGTYPEGQVPEELRDRLRTLLGDSGTSVQNDSISILYYRLRYGRISPYRAMILGDWQDAVPRLYAEMRETLERWERAAG